MEYYIKKREKEEENKYIIFRPEIGKGSYSKVYKGMNKNREYIGIKIVNIENMSEEIVELIEKEIEIHKNIENENIVKLNDVIRKNKKICMIMEYCETDLEKIKYELFDEYNIEDIFKQINNALKYLYENNITHRDLKPSNILLKNKQIKLADFGFASNKKVNMYETLCGSPLYMAPELLKISLIINDNNKINYDSKCDIWSYGLILYECIYLNHPYMSSISILDLYNKQNKININFLEENKINKKINPEFIELLKLMLKINSNERISWSEYFNHSFILKNKNIILLNQNISKNIIINNDNKGNKEKCGYSESYPRKDEMMRSEIIEDYIKKESEDYIIIKKEDLINSEINRERTVKDNIYYFLSNSVEYAKKPFKYFSF
jgi:serine/threonine protein kinase